LIFGSKIHTQWNSNVKKFFGSSRKKPTEEFTLDQLKLMHGLLNKEIGEIKK